MGLASGKNDEEIANNGSMRIRSTVQHLERVRKQIQGASTLQNGDKDSRARRINVPGWTGLMVGAGHTHSKMCHVRKFQNWKRKGIN